MWTAPDAGAGASVSTVVVGCRGGLVLMRGQIGLGGWL